MRLTKKKKKEMRLKKYFIASVAIMAGVLFMSLRPADSIVTEEDGFTVINTTTLADDVDGYAGPTPLKIYIKANKIEKVVALKNDETPKYLAVIKRKLLTKWNGLTVKKAATQKVDVITGATCTSEAVIEHVKRGAVYYNKNVKR